MKVRGLEVKPVTYRLRVECSLCGKNIEEYNQYSLRKAIDSHKQYCGGDIANCACGTCGNKTDKEPGCVLVREISTKISLPWNGIIRCKSWIPVSAEKEEKEGTGDSGQGSVGEGKL